MNTSKPSGDGEFSGGRGTREDPWKIATADDFVTMIRNFAGADYKKYASAFYVQEADIDMSSKGTLSPLGYTDSTAFAGEYDGAAHTLSGLKIKSTDACPDNAGVFGILKGTVRGMRIVGADIQGAKSVGGIAGSLAGGTISDCRVDRTSIITASKEYAGGIVGSVQDYDGTIDGCCCSAAVTGLHNVGGILGFFYDKKGGFTLTVTNNVFSGNSLTATGNYNSNYALVGGITGWLRSTASTTTTKINVLNCCSSPVLLESKQRVSNPSLAGVIAQINVVNGTKVRVEGCYSTIIPSRMKINGKTLENTSAVHFGGIYGAVAAVSSIGFRYCYWHSSMQMGKPAAYVTFARCESIPTARFANGELLTGLNAFKLSVSDDLLDWEEGTDRFPVQKGRTIIPVSPDEEPVTISVRVSLIGDSITTYEDWIPSGYKTYYPKGTLNDVKYTYWYRLINDKMKDAVLEKNNSYSGTTVTPCSSRTAGTDFGSRFVSQGCGEPDVIIINGGANDYNIVEGVSGTGGTGFIDLYPGMDMYNCKTGSVPADKWAPIFAAADAATTYDKAKALSTASFCQAYVRLVQMCRTRYPDASMLLIIPDWLYKSESLAIKDIAEHYKEGDKVRCIDFFVNAPGGNTNIPKVTTAHPDPTGMQYMSDRIYSANADWLDSARITK